MNGAFEAVDVSALLKTALKKVRSITDKWIHYSAHHVMTHRTHTNIRNL